MQNLVENSFSSWIIYYQHVIVNRLTVFGMVNEQKNGVCLNEMQDNKKREIEKVTLSSGSNSKYIIVKQ